MSTNNKSILSWKSICPRCYNMVVWLWGYFTWNLMFKSGSPHSLLVCLFENIFIFWGGYLSIYSPLEEKSYDNRFKKITTKHSIQLYVKSMCFCMWRVCVWTHVCCLIIMFRGTLTMKNIEATICSFLVDVSLEQMCRGSKHATRVGHNL